MPSLFKVEKFFTKTMFKPMPGWTEDAAWAEVPKNNQDAIEFLIRHYSEQTLEYARTMGKAWKYGFAEVESYALTGLYEAILDFAKGTSKPFDVLMKEKVEAAVDEGFEGLRWKRQTRFMSEMEKYNDRDDLVPNAQSEEVFSDGEESAREPEEKELWNRTIRRLPPRYRQILDLTVKQKLKPEEIAELLSIHLDRVNRLIKATELFIRSSRFQKENDKRTAYKIERFRGKSVPNRCRVADCNRVKYQVRGRTYELCRKHWIEQNGEPVKRLYLGQRYCKVDGCKNKARRDGYCLTHLVPVLDANPSAPRCSECNKAAIVGKLCLNHYQREKNQRLRSTACKVDGCGSKTYLRGLCRQHWAAERAKLNKKCSVAGCGKLAIFGNRCHQHRKGTGEVGICSVILCKNKRYTHGLCEPHYKQYRAGTLMWGKTLVTSDRQIETMNRHKEAYHRNKLDQIKKENERKSQEQRLRKKFPTGDCGWRGCFAKEYSAGFCAIHYQHALRKNPELIRIGKELKRQREQAVKEASDWEKACCDYAKRMQQELEYRISRIAARDVEIQNGIKRLIIGEDMKEHRKKVNMLRKKKCRYCPNKEWVRGVCPSHYQTYLRLRKKYRENPELFKPWTDDPKFVMLPVRLPPKPVEKKINAPVEVPKPIPKEEPKMPVLPQRPKLELVTETTKTIIANRVPKPYLSLVVAPKPEKPQRTMKQAVGAIQALHNDKRKKFVTKAGKVISVAIRRTPVKCKNCDRKTVSWSGMCDTHYNMYRRYKKLYAKKPELFEPWVDDPKCPTVPVRLYRAAPPSPCRICGRQARAKGLCGAHHSLYMKRAKAYQKNPEKFLPWTDTSLPPEYVVKQDREIVLKDDKKCSLGCPSKAVGKGFCVKCYNRYKTAKKKYQQNPDLFEPWTDDPDNPTIPILKPVPVVEKYCIEPGCNTIAAKRGYCGLHYKAMLKREKRGECGILILTDFLPVPCYPMNDVISISA